MAADQRENLEAGLNLIGQGFKAFILALFDQSPATESQNASLKPVAQPKKGSWLTIKEAAELLSVSESALRKWVDGGDIPHRRVKSELRFIFDEINEWSQPEPKKPQQPKLRAVQ